MVSAEDLKKDDMFFEAVDRMELMGAHPQDRWMVLMNRALDCKIVVDHQAKTVRRIEIEESELEMIRECEAKYGFICYYMIRDEGVWPDGCTFPRITLLYVDRDETEYKMIREECIGRCKTVPAYVINLEEPECSELAEISFGNVGGLLLNAS